MRTGHTASHAAMLEQSPVGSVMNFQESGETFATATRKPEGFTVVSSVVGEGAFHAAAAAAADHLCDLFTRIHGAL